MTSYEGLYLSTGRADEGREVLRTSAATVSEGMLANTADTGSLEYNTVDGTLWFVHALGRHVSVTGDDELGSELAPVLEQIVQHHLDGTRYGIGVDPADGLLAQGADGFALTWMDARIDGVPVTPRAGKPVEVNALWLRALAVAGGLSADRRFATGARSCASRRRPRSPRASFARTALGLLDVVDGPGGDDASVRPNQLLAVSLPGGPLGAREAARRRRGLPRLAADPARAPLALARTTALPALPSRAARPSATRAYHQGTVWPWLLGPYLDAADVAGVPTDGVLAGIEAHLADWGLGSVSETADGAAPHAATGCPFQAWSVAELLRVLSSRE